MHITNLQSNWKASSFLDLKKFFFFEKGSRSHPGSSAGKESACSAGDPGLIPGLQGSPGEGIGYPLQYTWASPNGSAGKESSCNVRDLGSIPGEDLLEKGMATHSNILAWKIP